MQFLAEVDMPVCVQQQGGSDSAETLLVPQVQFIVGSSRCEHAAKESSRKFQRERLSLFFCPFSRAFFRLRPFGR